MNAFVQAVALLGLSLTTTVSLAETVAYCDSTNQHVVNLEQVGSSYRLSVTDYGGHPLAYAIGLEMSDYRYMTLVADFSHQECQVGAKEFACDINGIRAARILEPYHRTHLYAYWVRLYQGTDGRFHFRYEARADRAVEDRFSFHDAHCFFAAD